MNGEPVKIYLAAPWVAKEQAKQVAAQLEAEGFVLTSRWINHHSVAVGKTYDEQMRDHGDIMREQAIEDVLDIYAADVFVILNLEKSEGKATELGIAFTLGLPIALIGERSRNIFYYLPQVQQFDNLEQFIEGYRTAVNEVAA